MSICYIRKWLHILMHITYYWRNKIKMKTMYTQSHCSNTIHFRLCFTTCPSSGLRMSVFSTVQTASSITGVYFNFPYYSIIVLYFILFALIICIFPLHIIFTLIFKNGRWAEKLHIYFSKPLFVNVMEINIKLKALSGLTFFKNYISLHYMWLISHFL